MTLLYTLTAIPLGYALVALTVLLALCAFWILRLELRLRRLVRGKSGYDLEGTIVHIHARQKEHELFRTEIEAYLTQVERRLARSVSEVKTVRFNPFKGTGMGGNQSFATALLNEDGDGVILSSLYARDHVSMFAKPIIRYTSEHELTGEEQAVLNDARTSLSHKK